MSAIGRIPIAIEARAAILLEVRGVTANTRAVLHLWDVAAQREVARTLVGAGSVGDLLAPWRSRNQLRYQNLASQPRRYQLLLHTRAAAMSGTADVYRDGQLLQRALPAGGALLHMRSGPHITHRVAATPGSPHTAILLTLDRDAQLIALDERSGATGLPQLQGSAAIASLVLGTVAPIEASIAEPLVANATNPSHAAASKSVRTRGDATGTRADESREDANVHAGAPRPGRLRIYSNDAIDQDGDGVGRRLERALGTCDAPSEPACTASPLSAYYRQVGTRDSDRDGISDADELFGVNAPALDLPRFGSDPRHKDVFVEVDHQARLDTLGFSERDFVDIAALFKPGSARALRNPDGLGGVHMHFDAGFTPQDSALLGLIGDYGGSGPTTANDYHEARRRDFRPERSGYFRYAFSTRSGRGQANRDAFTVNRDLARVTIFAHELGHTLGLAHHGHDSWGRANCKPNYFSIMNYLYQARYEVGFSRRSTRALNPAHVLERGAVAPAVASLLRDPPLELDVNGRDVDWNRDGLISAEPVRAGLLWATYKSCGSGEQGLTTLAERDVAAATPVLLQSGDALHAFWLDTTGRLWWRRAQTSDAEPSWSQAAQLAADGGAMRFIAGIALPDSQLALACVLGDGAIALRSWRVSPVGLVPVSSVQVQAVPGAASAPLLAARTEHAPGLVWSDVSESFYGASRLLSVLFRAAGDDGGLYQASATDVRGPFAIRPLVDASAVPLTAAGGPSVLRLPTGELCGAWPDAQSFVRFACYDLPHDRWVDLSSRAFDVGLGPHTSGQVGLGFHRYRDASGAPIDFDTSRGALFLSFSEPPVSSARYPDNPHFFVSEWLSARHGAFEQISLRWRGSVISEWTTLAAGTGLSLSETDDGLGLKALMAIRDDAHQTTRLELMPHADGEGDQQLGSGDDFEVMERGICTGIRSNAECGDATTAAY